MHFFLMKLSGFARRWVQETDAIAAAESALVFPLLLTLLLGVYDMGNGILTNQKAIRASQVVADLVTRNEAVSASSLDDIIKAGELAFAPFSSTSYGVDVVSISFDEDAEPQIVWRETRNMTANPDVLEDVISLAEAGNGVVVVSVRYTFEPVFAGFIVDNIPMQEVAFARGRKSAVVTLN